jgi:hypothetical protein
MLNEFYKKTLNSVGLFVTEDGFIKTSGEEDGMLVTEEGKPLVLPTKDHINSIMTTDEDGNVVIGKLPYNPLNENVIKGDTLSLKRTKTAIEVRTGLAIACAGILLLTLASEKELQKKTTIDVNEFLGSLNKAMAPGIKELVDDKSIAVWQSLFVASLKQENGYISIYLKKMGVKDGVKYNRLATLACNLYDELSKADKDTPVFGIKLRNKDLSTFKLLLEFLLPGIEEGSVSYGSLDQESPGFISLMSLYKKVAFKSMAIIKQLKHINAEVADKGFIDIIITDEDINTTSKFKSELLTIPNEIDLSRSKAKPELSNLNVNNNMLKSVGGLAQAPVEQQPVPNNNVYVPQQNQAPVQQVAQFVPQPDPFGGDPVKKILYGSGYQPTSHAIPREEYDRMMYEQQMINNQAMMNNPQMMGVQSGMMPNNMYNPQQNQFAMQQQPVSMGINTIANAGGNMYPNNMGNYGMNNGMQQPPFNTPYTYR